jgi:hypothetical protein
VGTSDSAGSFASISTGAAPTEDWHYQYNWNLDRGLGYQDISTINWQKGNVFEIDLQWLGFGNITFQIENPRTGKFTKAHILEYSNKNSQPSLINPNLPLSICVEKTAGDDATNLVVSSASMGGFIMGNVDNTIGVRMGAAGSYSTASGALVAGTKYNILTVRNDTTFNNLLNISEKYLLTMSVGLQSGSNITRGGLFVFYVAPTLDNSAGLTWTKRNASLSTVSYCTDVVEVSGGIELLSVPCGPNFQVTKKVTALNLFIAPGRSVTAAFIPFVNMAASPDTNTSNIVASILWLDR